ncbi:MAG: hypothetical protein KGZ88_11955 [Methylomicrobium sp.]|nr:hypothetical protein [Methylomicrobium sp.]
MTRLIIEKQDEITLTKTVDGYIEIRSDVMNMGEQLVFVSPRNAIILGEALIRFAFELIQASDLAELENREN